MLCKISCVIRWIEDGEAEEVFFKDLFEEEVKFKFYMNYLASNDSIKDIHIHYKRL